MKNYKKLLSNLNIEELDLWLVELPRKFGIDQDAFRVTGKKKFSIWISYSAWQKFFEAAGAEFV